MWRLQYVSVCRRRLCRHKVGGAIVRTLRGRTKMRVMGHTAGDTVFEANVIVGRIVGRGQDGLELPRG